MVSSEKYQDKTFFLVAIAFISAFNYYLTYTGIRFNWFFVITYLADTVQGLLAWWAMRSIIIYLDDKLPYADRPLKRIILQCLFTVVAGLLIIIILTELTSWVLKGRPALTNFYLFDIFILVIWFLVINGIYIGLHYYDEWKKSEITRLQEKKQRSGGFTVRNGKQNLLVPFNEIVSFYIESGYTMLLTLQGKKYLTEKSLDKIEPVLPEESFFRLNRQYIVHRSSLTGFKRTGEGKIDALLNAPGIFPKAIPISRIKASGFKTWFESDDR